MEFIEKFPRTAYAVIFKSRDTEVRTLFVKRANYSIAVIALAFFVVTMFISCDEPETVTTKVNAVQPTITAQPVGGFWNVFPESKSTFELTVTANVTDSGITTYQWYSNTSNNASGGTAITTGGTNAALTLNKTGYNTNGIRYFYVVVTNTNVDVNGNKIASITSAVAEVVVVGNPDTAYTTSAMPENLKGTWISESEYPESYVINETTFDSGYYKGTIVGHRSNSDSGGYITIEYTEAFNPASIGQFYVIHYKELSVSEINLSGAYLGADPDFDWTEGTSGKATQAEAEATMTVSAGYFGMYSSLVKEKYTDADHPIISAQPTGGEWDIDKNSTFQLTVTANVSDSGTLTYKWYSNTSSGNSGGSAITEATTDHSLTLNKTIYTADNTYYFYVEVINTNDSASGNKTANTISDVVAVIVIDGFVIPLDGFWQAEFSNIMWYTYNPDMGGYYVDSIFVNAETKSFSYYQDSAFETYWGGDIVTHIPEAGDEPAILIVKINEVGGAWSVTPETGKYLAYAYKNMAGSIVSTATAFKDDPNAKNTGVDTIAEAIIEYTAANKYFDYFGTYVKRVFASPATLNGIQGNYYNEDMEYYIQINGTTYIEFMDDYEDGNIGVYDPNDDWDMIAAIGLIVDCTDTSLNSGILYVQVLGSDVFSNFQYIAVAWRNRDGNDIGFMTGNNANSTLAGIKSEYGDISKFNTNGFFDYIKQ